MELNEEDLMKGTEFYEDDIEDTGEPFEFDFNPVWFESEEQLGGIITPVFGELLQTGWDWGRDSWTTTTINPDVLTAVRSEINRKIEERYFMRELSIEIPGRWKLMFKRTIESLMDQYGPIYNENAKGIDLSGITETKTRTVNSEFPQSRLNPEIGDYASNSAEYGSETISSESTLRAIELYNKTFNNLDNKVVDGLDKMFSHYPYWLNTQITDKQYNYYF